MTKIIYELIGDPEQYVMSFDDFNDASAAYANYHVHEGRSQLWVFEGAMDEDGDSVCGAIKRELIKFVFLVESEDERDKPDFAKSFHIGMNKHLEDKVKQLSDEIIRLKKEVSELELHLSGANKELTHANTVIERHKMMATDARKAIISRSIMSIPMAVGALDMIIFDGSNS